MEGYQSSSSSLSRREDRRREKEVEEDRYDCCKNFAFLFVGVLTLLYTLGELGFGAWFHVLVLLSDGFHNLSDVVALGIALWASKKSRQTKSMEYSYGYARTELLGALVNGCFLLSLALYILLEAIPKFIKPDEPERNLGISFIVYAGVGLGLNVTGAIVFFITGKGHSHAGHDHGHSGDDDHKPKAHKQKKKVGHADEGTSLLMNEAASGSLASINDDKPKKKKKDHHGHEHGHGHEDDGHSHEHHDDHKKKKKEKKAHHDHEHGHDDEHKHSHSEEKGKSELQGLLLAVEQGHEDDVSEHSHDHAHDDAEKKKKKKNKDHGHSHDHDAHDHDHAHGHDDDGKKEKKKKDKHEHEHGHDHKKKDKKDHGHAHNHDEHDDYEDDHDGHSHGSEGHHDANVHAIFLHFLGDALSSVFVLATALLWYFFFDPDQPTKNVWVQYVDPAASIIVVGIILFSTIPLVRSVLSVLLQRAPKGVDVMQISYELRQIDCVASVHDLHIWELISGVSLASVHMDIQGSASEFAHAVKAARRVFHRNKIHSVTIQPEFVSDDHPGRTHCEDMCVEECVETWCCEPDLSKAEELHNI